MFLYRAQSFAYRRTKDLIPQDRSLITMHDRLGLHCLPQSYKGTLGLYWLNKERFDTMSLGFSPIIDVTSKAGPEGKDGRGPDTPWKITSVYRFP